MSELPKPTEDNDAEEEGKSSSHHRRASASALIDAFAQQYRVDREEAGRREGHRIFREWLTIIGLFLAALVAFFQWRELRSTDHSIGEQAKIAADQLRELQSTGKQTDTLIETNKKLADAAAQSARTAEGALTASQRPWVSVAMAVGSDLKFNKEGGRVTILFVMRNVGKTPATGVWVDAEIYPIGPIRNDEIAEQRRVCEAAKQRSISNTLMGYRIFPEEVFTFSDGLPISQADIERHQADLKASYKEPVPTNWFTAALVGCVNYHFAFDGSLHQTGFIAQLGRGDPNNPDMRLIFDLDAGDVPKGLLRLDTFFMGGYAN